MTRRVVGIILALVMTLVLWPLGAFAQGPTVEGSDVNRLQGATSLGPLPGSGGSRGNAPADIESYLGGRPGPSVPRVPSSISRPGPRPSASPRIPITVPPPKPPVEQPAYGPLALPEEAEGVEEGGRTGGMTLDAALERLVNENLDLRALAHEIPKARADILTASLRNNPIFYADSQLIPYGGYSKQRSGGPTQYDVNISYPLDLSHKRQARTGVACQARLVLEAQYQDAVRDKIAAFYNVYVDILGARETVRYARASVDGFTQLLARAGKLQKQGERSRGDVERIKLQLNAARIGLADAEEMLRGARRPLTPLLRIPLAESESLALAGALSDRGPPPPVGDELIAIALAGRPDLVAARLGIGLAQADQKLAHAERYQDLYLLYQPYTFQSHSPAPKGSHSWALGVTVPMPVYNRNQGNIERARVNVSQTQTQLAALELRVATEVRDAEREYVQSRAAVEGIERDLLPGAVKLREGALRSYHEGESSLGDYLDARRDFNELLRQYRDAQVRHRRSMLTLNTAVGRRLLP